MTTLIVIEGVDATGKSSTARALSTKLIEAGHQTLLAREPGFTEVGERIRSEFLLSHEKLTTISLFYLFQVARMEMLEAFRVDHSHNEYIVLDRFWPSTLAYQVYGSGISTRMFECAQEEVRKAVGKIGTEIDICLTLPEDIRLQRIKESGKGADRYESKPKEFTDRVKSAYDDMVKKCWLHPVDSSADLSTVVDHIYDFVTH